MIRLFAHRGLAGRIFWAVCGISRLVAHSAQRSVVDVAEGLSTHRWPVMQLHFHIGGVWNDPMPFAVGGLADSGGSPHRRSFRN